MTLTFWASSNVAQVWRRSCGLIARREALERIGLRCRASIVLRVVGVPMVLGKIRS